MAKAKDIMSVSLLRMLGFLKSKRNRKHGGG